jgi:hypothetical protein
LSVLRSVRWVIYGRHTDDKKDYRGIFVRFSCAVGGFVFQQRQEDPNGTMSVFDRRRQCDED